jgi:hypothetical protein
MLDHAGVSATRPKHRLRAALAALVLSFAGCSHFAVAPASDAFEEGRHGRASLVLRDELAIATLGGTPEEIGEQLAALAGEPLLDLLATWRRLEVVRSLFTSTAPKGEAVLPPDHLRELAAVASASSVALPDLVRANGVIDGCACTAFVASGAWTRNGTLIFGRNLDFMPANVLGPATLVLVVHPTGKRAFASVAWPGFSAVASVPRPIVLPF